MAVLHLNSGAGKSTAAPYIFGFCERNDVWRIELDMRPSGRFARVFVGTDPDGEAQYEERELDEGHVIARGSTDVDGYGTTLVERAKFIVSIIRVHLVGEACNLHVQDLSSIQALLGREVRWCPSCGTRVSHRLTVLVFAWSLSFAVGWRCRISPNPRFDPFPQFRAVPPAGFEPATPALGEPCSIP
jgi:hypothetical protein